MSEFTIPGLKLNFFEKAGRRAVLLDPILYELGFEGSGNWLIVPSGFVTDGASVPRFLWWFLPPWGSKASKAAIVHDYLLQRLAEGNPWPGYEIREDIDAEFFRAMHALDINDYSAFFVWCGVSLMTTVKTGKSSLRLQ